MVIQIAVFTIVLHYQESAPFNPWGAPLMVALAMAVVHVLVCSVQAVRAYRGKTLRFGGFPFFRGPGPHPHGASIEPSAPGPGGGSRRATTAPAAEAASQVP